MADQELLQRLETLARRREEAQETLRTVSGAVSEAIRAADAAGMSRSEIAAALRMSRQAIYNVLDD